MKLNHPVGAKAEQIAFEYLQQQGLKLIERNWHCPFGEIDLIMQERNSYIFIEVKYRKTKLFGGAIYSINQAKCARIMRTAEFYLQTKRIDAPCRIDAVILQANETPVWLKNILG